MVSKTWLLLTVPAFAVAAVLLVLVVRSLVHRARSSVVATVALVPEQRIDFASAGDFVLNGEGRHFTSDFASLSFALEEQGTGRAVPLHRILVRTKVSSFDSVRLALQGFHLTSPGTYVLRVTGLDPARSTDSRIVFSRPWGVALVLHVLALVVLGATLILSIVLSALALK